MKEQGLLKEAENAYRKAISIGTGETDAALHLAHLLTRPDYRADNSPTLLDIRPPSATRGGTYIELKDLFQYLSLHTTVTGITRVTLSLVHHVLENLVKKSAENYHFVHQFGDAEGLLLIPKDKMRRIVQAAMEHTPDISAMQILISEIRTTSPKFRLEAGDTYLIVGAFWEFVANPSWIGGMRHRGVFIGAYIYDLIPITHAQYCMLPLTEAFTVAFAETARLLDFALTISEFVAHQVLTYLTVNGIQPFPIIAVPLAHELRFQSEIARDALSDSRHHTPNANKRIYFEGMQFVLCVCTIEARKNHAYVFSIWEMMIKARIDVPQLVFVGRPGWRVESLLERVEESRYLNGKLTILNGLTDEELASLYDRCLFTVFPSYVEGWGLPVGESLSHGKVCVASSMSSIPEVGGEHVVYVDPFDIEEGYAAISELVCVRSKLSERESELRKSFVARSWKDVGHDFFAGLDRIKDSRTKVQQPRVLFAPRLESGTIFDVALLDKVGKRGEAYIKNPERLVFVEGWRGVESSGVWMLDAEAFLRVHTNCSPNEEVYVLLHVGTSPWVGPHNTLFISASGIAMEPGTNNKTGYHRTMRKTEEFWLNLKGTVDENCHLGVRFHVSGQITAEESNVPVGLRVKSLGYAPLEDIPARLRLLETALIP